MIRYTISFIKSPEKKRKHHRKAQSLFFTPRRTQFSLYPILKTQLSFLQRPDILLLLPNQFGSMHQLAATRPRQTSLSHRKAQNLMQRIYFEFFNFEHLTEPDLLPYLVVVWTFILSKTTQRKSLIKLLICSLRYLKSKFR